MNEPKIPSRTARAHYLQSDPRCDQVATLNKARRRKGGRRRGFGYADMNLVRCANGNVNLHWADSAVKNHYRYIIGSNGRRRAMTGSELHRPVIEWNLADILKWRKTKRVGVSLNSRAHPASVITRQRQAKRRKVIICWEVKSRVYKNPATAKSLIHDVRASGWPGYFMTLVIMKDWGPKLKAIHQAGGQTALLAHGARKPSNLNLFAPYIDAVWGRWR